MHIVLLQIRYGCNSPLGNSLIDVLSGLTDWLTPLRGAGRQRRDRKTLSQLTRRFFRAAHTPSGAAAVRWRRCWAALCTQ